MLDYERIKEIAAQKGVLDVVVEKDYILDWILWGIAENRYLRNLLVFKGGTALHKMYFSDWRFSEDLDFTTIRQAGKDELHSAVKELCVKVHKQSGIRLQQKEMIASGNKDSEWSFEIRIEYVGPRRQSGGDLPTILIHVTNDEPLADKPVRKMVITPYEDLSRDFFTLTYSIEEALAEKIRTVFYQRCWPRDVWDTWRLLRETRTLIDIGKVLDIYSCKALYRGFHSGLPADLDERILRIKNQWRQGLQRQIGAPPDFDKVYPDVKDLLVQLFEDNETIKKGDITMLESHYVIRYRKGDLEIEVQGDKDFVDQQFKELLTLRLAESKKESPLSSVSISSNEAAKKMSLAEFLKAKNPKSHGDKFLTFGYFLEKVKGFSAFNLNDVEGCYKEARSPKTKNFSPYITRLIRNGYLMDAGEKKDNKKAWILTDSGLRYVEALVPDTE